MSVVVYTDRKRQLDKKRNMFIQYKDVRCKGLPEHVQVKARYLKSVVTEIIDYKRLGTVEPLHNIITFQFDCDDNCTSILTGRQV